MDASPTTIVVAAFVAVAILAALLVSVWLAWEWLYGYVRLHRRRRLVLPGYRVRRKVL